MRLPLLLVQSSSCLTLLGPAAAKRQPSGADATRSVAAHFEMAMGHNVRLDLLNQFSPSRAARLACSHSLCNVPQRRAARATLPCAHGPSRAASSRDMREANEGTTRWIRATGLCRLNKSCLALRPIRGNWPDNVWQRETKLSLYAGAHPPAILIDSLRMRGSDTLKTSDKAHRLIFKESWTCVARQEYFNKDLPK